MSQTTSAKWLGHKKVNSYRDMPKHIVVLHSKNNQFNYIVLLTPNFEMRYRGLKKN